MNKVAFQRCYPYLRQIYKRLRNRNDDDTSDDHIIDELTNSDTIHGNTPAQYNGSIDVLGHTILISNNEDNYFLCVIID